jgi:hypothetical protein
MAQRAHSADERWFAQHPERRWMVRPALAGEFPAEVRHATHVLIVRDTGGRYHGKPVLMLNPADYPRGRIPLEHQEMAHDVMGRPRECCRHRQRSALEAANAGTSGREGLRRPSRHQNHVSINQVNPVVTTAERTPWARNPC